MTDSKSSLTLEEKLKLANQKRPSAEYLDRLHATIDSQFTSYQGQKFFSMRPAWIAASALIVIFIVGTLIIGPKRVYAEVAKLFGYIPGVGIVDQSETIRVLSEPVSVARNGITVTVSEVTITKEKTRLIYTIENTPNSVFSHDENITGCSEQAYLILPNGSILRPTDGWGSQYTIHNDFDSLPEDVMEAAFVLPCISGTLPGKAPENWKIPLRFRYAQPDTTIAPIFDLEAPLSTTEKQTLLPDSTAYLNDPYGIALSLDQVIPLEDGYYLIGHTDWKDDRIKEAYPAGWNMKAFDANGREIPVKPASWDEAGLTVGENQWLYKLYGNSFNNLITLKSTLMTLSFVQPVEFSLDLQDQGFDGSETQIGRVWEDRSTVIELPELSATIDQISYIKSGELRGFELSIQADSVLRQLPLNIVSGLDYTGLEKISGGGGSNRDPNDDLIKTTILTNAKISFPLVLSANGAAINGVWQVTWQPPDIDGSGSPTASIQPCVTLEKWQQTLKGNAAIPEDLSQSVLVNRGALAPDPSLFLTNLDGSEEQGLAFGYGSISANGSTLVYADQFGNILRHDVATGNEKLLTQDMDDTNPLIAPDGQEIAFTRTGDDQQIVIMNIDGSNPRTIVSGLVSPQAWQWTPDGDQILFWTKSGEGSSLVQLVNPETGDISKLFSTNTEAPVPVISPDGKWIAYMDRVPGYMADGLYIANTDGTNRRLVVQLDYWQLVGRISWTPDGEWLSFSVLDSDAYSPASTVGLVNIYSCQVFSLPQLNGVILDWVYQ